IDVHGSFPYKEFGYYCDAVMPQCYWNEIGHVNGYTDVNCSATQMEANMTIQWKKWQNTLAGKWTNSIKPICAAGSAWNATCSVAGSDILAFINALKNDASPATTGGYHGVNFWRAELQTTDMWTGVSSGNIGTTPKIVKQPVGVTVTNTSPVNATFS